MRSRRRPASPPQTIGPFFHSCLMRGYVPDDVRGTEGVIRVQGHVADAQGAPVDDAMLEFSHAAIPKDIAVGRAGSGSARPLFHRVATGQDGYYEFSTLMPFPELRKPLPAVSHLNIHIFARGLLDRLSTRVYFAHSSVHPEDDYFRELVGARAYTLIASPADRTGKVYDFNINFGGKNETVFFEI